MPCQKVFFLGLQSFLPPFNSLCTHFQVVQPLRAEFILENDLNHIAHRIFKQFKLGLCVDFNYHMHSVIACLMLLSPIQIICVTAFD
ncbi:hypothetical protein WJ94_29350 [Burkholderia ubonensis]|nr:hypothetical protein WJ94_29350 [Burkholderia ubonensis]